MGNSIRGKPTHQNIMSAELSSGRKKKGALNFKRSRYGALLVFLLTVSAACSRSDNAETASRHFQVRGIVRTAPNTAIHTLEIEHEDIPGFMPSMTMPFGFHDAHEVEALAVGSAIAFTLTVTDKEMWISGVRHVDVQGIKVAGAKPLFKGKIDRLKEGDAMPAFELVNQSDQPLHLQTYAGKALLVTFIFTRCPIPMFCPLISKNFQEIHDAVLADPVLKRGTKLLSISFDEADSPRILSEYGTRFCKNFDSWEFATGKPEQIQALTRAFAVQVQVEGGSISHGLTTALIGPDGVVLQLWRGNGWKPDEVLAALRRI